MSAFYFLVQVNGIYDVASAAAIFLLLFRASSSSSSSSSSNLKKFADLHLSFFPRSDSRYIACWCLLNGILRCTISRKRRYAVALSYLVEAVVFALYATKGGGWGAVFVILTSLLLFMRCLR